MCTAVKSNGVKQSNYLTTAITMCSFVVEEESKKEELFIWRKVVILTTLPYLMKNIFK